MRSSVATTYRPGTIVKGEDGNPLLDEQGRPVQEVVSDDRVDGYMKSMLLKNGRMEFAKLTGIYDKAQSYLIDPVFEARPKMKIPKKTTELASKTYQHPTS